MGLRKRSSLAEREQYVRDYTFPAPVLDRVRTGNPTLTADGLARVETALREWLVACTYRDGRELANPSTIADVAWSEFAACTPDYAEFCRHAFGRIEPPRDLQPGTPPEVAAANAVAAWDRSRWSDEREVSCSAATVNWAYRGPGRCWCRSPYDQGGVCRLHHRQDAQAAVEAAGADRRTIRRCGCSPRSTTGAAGAGSTSARCHETVSPGPAVSADRKYLCTSRAGARSLQEEPGSLPTPGGGLRPR